MRNKKNKYSSILPKGSGNVQIPKTGHTPNSLAHDHSGIPSVVPNSLKEFSSKIYQSNMYNAIWRKASDTRSINNSSFHHSKYSATDELPKDTISDFLTQKPLHHSSKTSTKRRLLDNTSCNNPSHITKTKGRTPSYLPNPLNTKKSSVNTNDKRRNEGTASHSPNSPNKSPVNASAKRMNERVHPPNSLNKTFQNTNGKESIDKSPSHSITSSSIPQDHGKTKKHILLPDGSSLIFTSNNHRDSKYTSPIKSDYDPSSATIKSHNNKLKLFSNSRTKSADKGSRHTLPNENSHYSSFTTNNQDHDDILKPARSDNQSFSHEKFKYPKSFSANLPTKEKTSIDMKASKYTPLSSQRFETHLKLLEAKSYSNFLLSRNADRIKKFAWIWE